MKSLFNEIIDCAYGEAICYDMSGYYAHCIDEKLSKLCKSLEEKYPFVKFTHEYIDFTCEFKIIVNVGRITSKQLDKIAAELPGMKMNIADSNRIEFSIDDEKYFENNFINGDHQVTGKSLLKKYGLKVFE